MARILIIEDETAIAELEKDYLELSDFEVVLESDGSGGAARALDEDFDLIILDLMLPGMNGFDICKLIRETKNTPIIMVSAKKDDIDKIRGLGLGADDYITKPIKPKELERLLGRYLGWESDEQEAKTVPEGIFHVLEQGEINVTNGLQFADGDVEFYRNLLEMFIKEYEEKREKIHTTDIDEYFIAQVHGIKGEARGIGAERLGNLFEELEETAKQGNSRQVEELLPEAMQEWERIVRLIQTVLS